MVIRQLQVERRTGKVRQSTTDVLPTVPGNQRSNIMTTTNSHKTVVTWPAQKTLSRQPKYMHPHRIDISIIETACSIEQMKFLKTCKKLKRNEECEDEKPCWPVPQKSWSRRGRTEWCPMKRQRSCQYDDAAVTSLQPSTNHWHDNEQLLWRQQLLSHWTTSSVVHTEPL